MTKKITFLLSVLFALNINAQNPGLVISKAFVDPTGTDSCREYVELIATQNINFSLTPYTIIACTNGFAPPNGWAAGSFTTYAFMINSGSITAGSVAYVGGSCMTPTSNILRAKQVHRAAGDGSVGVSNQSGVFGNGGGSVDGIAVFNLPISSITKSTVPTDAFFYATAIGLATLTSSTDGYELPVNDIYAGGKLSGTSFFFSNSSNQSMVAKGVYNLATNTWSVARTYTTSTSASIGTSSVTLATSGSVAPATFSFVSTDTTVMENASTASIYFKMSASCTSTSAISIYATAFSSAGATDYTIANTTFSFAANTAVNTTTAITININDDAILESAEYIVIRFYNPQNATISSSGDMCVFYIDDNDRVIPAPTNSITLNLLSSFSNSLSGTNSAEIVVHDPTTQRLYIANSVGKKLDIIDFVNPSSLTLLNSISIATYGNINSVAVKNGIVACAIEDGTNPQDSGKVVFFDKDGTFLKQVKVGMMPEMITFNHAGTKVITANEGEPNITYSNDPDGSVSIIDISGGISSLAQTNVAHATFTAYNGQEATLRTQGIRIYGTSASSSKDFEPEYVTILPNDTIAWVTLQENNALAKINLNTNSVIAVTPMGTKNLKLVTNRFDASNTTKGVNLSTFPGRALFLPDAIASYAVGGVNYIVTANEGDARSYFGLIEERRISALTIDPDRFPFVDQMKRNSLMGRLNISSKSGDNDNDGDLDSLFTLGGRSFSIWSANTGGFVYDSRDDFESILSTNSYSVLFNANNTNNNRKDRSDDKGPEPEGVVIGKIDTAIYAFITLARIGGVMVYDITNPTAAVYVTYVNNRSLTGNGPDNGAEGVIFIPQSQSPNGQHIVIAANEVSSSLSIWGIPGCVTPLSSSVSVTGPTTNICSNNAPTLSVPSNVNATYQWSKNGSVVSGATSHSYVPTSSGDYFVAIDGGPKCITSSLSKSFSITPSPTITITGNDSICVGASLSQTLAGASSYSVNAGTTTSVVVLSPATTTVYTITGISGGTCSDTLYKTITVNTIPQIVLTPSTTTICSGQSFISTASGASTYSWNSGATTASLSDMPTANTVYTVTGTSSSNCSSTLALNVSVNAAPQLTLTPSSSTICTGQSFTSTASGASTYSWNSGATTASLSDMPAANTVYTITGTNSANCSSTLTLNVNVTTIPQLTLSPSTTTICSGQSFTSTASGASTYSWNSSATTASLSDMPTANTVYTVTGSSAANCSSTGTLAVTVNTLPILSISGNSVICSGAASSQTVSGASTYSWNDGSTTPVVSLSPSVTTVYTVVGTSSTNGCSASTTKSITVNANPQLTITPSTATICSGQSFTGTASGASTYSWNSGATTASLSDMPAANTVYTVTGTDSANCSSTLTLNVSVTTIPQLTLSPSTTTICSGQSFTSTASGASTYSWNSSATTASLSDMPTANTVYTVTGSTAANCSSTGTLAVTVNTLPIVSINGNSVICSGAASSQTVSGASTYSWNDGSTTPVVSLSPSVTTVYTVVGTSSTNGCSASATKSITVNANPQLTITPLTTTICSGQSFTSTASGASTYSWNSGATTASLSDMPAANTVYTVTGTDSANCSSTLTLNVSVTTIPQLTLSPSTTTICSGQSFTSTASGASTYSWNSSATTASLSDTPTANTVYTVTGSAAANCSSTGTLAVTVNTLPIVSINGNSVICSGAASSQTVSGASTYSWNDGSTTSVVSLSPSVTTVYTVVGTLANGCSASTTKSITVNANPLLTITPSTATICSGQSFTGTASGASTYSWNSGATAASLSAMPTANTVYTVTGTSTANCSSTLALNVSVNAIPQLTLSPSSTTICAGQSFTSTASGASTYSLNSGATTASLSDMPTANTVYTVTGTSTANCSSTGTLAVTVNTLPIVSISGSSVICSGASSSQTVSGASTYSWNDGSTTSVVSLSPSVTTVYTVVGTLANGCNASTTKSITVNANPQLTITPSTATICSGQSFTGTASGASTYSWNSGATAASLSATPTANTVYTVTGTSTANCSSTLALNVSVNAIPQLTLSPSTTTICSGQSFTSTASGASTYSLNSTATTASLTAMPTANTVYTVTGTSTANCSSTGTLAVTVNTLPIVSISGSSVICSGAASSQTVSGASTYSWNNGSTTSVVSLSPSVTTVYTVVGTLASGCSASTTKSIAVNANPQLTITPSTATICSGQSFTRTASGASTYSWSSGATTASLSVMPTANTIYTVTGTSTANCSSTGTLAVTVNTLPIVSISGSSVICSGAASSQTVSGASTYSWNNGSTTSVVSLSPSVTTVYTVVGTLASGCSASATKSIAVSAYPQLTITPSTATICSGQSFTRTASGASTYSWSNGATTASLSVMPTANTIYTVTGTNTANCSSTGTLAVTVNTLPIVSISGSSVICSGASSSQTVSGASTYSWNNGSTTSVVSLSPSVTTVYTVVGTLASGCSASATKSIAVSAYPQLTITPSTATICSGQSFTGTASGASTYSWNNSATTASLSVMPTANTIYTVTGTNTANCSSTGTLAVTVNTLPIVSISGSSDICSGAASSQTVSGAATYSWNNGSTTSVVSLSPSVTTVYTVVGTLANGCSASATKSITVNANPQLTITPTTTTICSGQSFTGTASGASTYSWNSSATTATLSAMPTANTVYTVTGTSTANCSSTGTLAITVNTLPIVSISGSTVICLGDSTSQTVNGASTYSWSNGSTAPAVSLSPSVTTVYTVVGTLANGCSANAAVSISVNANPQLTITPPTGTICSGQLVSYIASGAATYTWSNLSTGATLSIAPFVTGTYTVTGTNSVGCSASMPFTVTVNPLPMLTILGDSMVCAGSSISQTVSGAATYSWNTGATTSVIVVSPAVTTPYTVIGTSTNGCNATISKNITVSPLPVLSVSSTSNQICSGETASLTVNGAASYSWSTGSAGTVIVVTPSITTTYTVNGTSSNNCTATMQFVQNVSKCLDIKAHKNQVKGVTLYPNPAIGEVFIEFENSQPARIKLFNSLGTLVIQNNHYNAGEAIKIGNLAKGIYFVHISIAGEQSVKKLIIN